MAVVVQSRNGIASLLKSTEFHRPEVQPLQSLISCRTNIEKRINFRRCGGAVFDAERVVVREAGEGREGQTETRKPKIPTRKILEMILDLATLRL